MILPTQTCSEKEWTILVDWSSLNYHRILFDQTCLLNVHFHFFKLGELHSRRDPRDHGQEAQHPQHVRYRPRRSRQVDPDRFPRRQGRHHRRSEGRRNENHGHQEGRARTLHHHQVHVRIFRLLQYPL